MNATNFHQVMETNESVFTNGKMFLKITKPSFFSPSDWEFTLGGQLVKAHIDDLYWLGKFNRRTITIKPGDVFEVEIETRHDYGFNHNMTAVTRRIKKVLNVHIPKKMKDKVEMYNYTGNFKIYDWENVTGKTKMKKAKITIDTRKNKK